MPPTAMQPAVTQYLSDVAHGVYAKQGYDQRHLEPRTPTRIDVAMAFTGGGLANSAPIP